MGLLEQFKEKQWIGPVCVGLGASLWGTETLWRVFLNKQFLPDVLVFYEHAYCLLFSLPLLWLFRKELKHIPLQAGLFLLGSGIIGSAVGTVLFTASLKTVNLSVANVLLNIQPFFSALYARWLLGERWQPGFWLWGAVAILGGVLLSLSQLSLQGFAFSSGLWLVLGTALCWSFATVAGRGVNLGISYQLATPLRFLIGLLATGALVLINQHTSPGELHLAKFSQWPVHQDFILLSFFAGVIPLYLYFKGLSLTQASVASFFEMFQVLAALLVTWGFFGHALAPHQWIGTLILLFAVARINQTQTKLECFE